jgi:hypothetical protein
MKNRCINATAVGILTIVADESLFVTGNGVPMAYLELTALCAPDGSDILDKVPADKRVTVRTRHAIRNHILTVDMPIMDGAVYLSVRVQLGADGTTLADGKITCTINKWLWRLMLKRATATFTGTRTEYLPLPPGRQIEQFMGA